MHFQIVYSLELRRKLILPDLQYSFCNKRPWYSLLALFGQGFAYQFLSQSTCWIECIIFAVGPLGVPAAITAAARVGGYDLLKGLVGRAKEHEIDMEKELLSSTSSEVCELWNGQKVVRLTASPIVDSGFRNECIA